MSASTKDVQKRGTRAAANFAAARAARDAAIVEGHGAGLSLRALAELTGLGVETVRRTLRANGVTT